jgi:hypothetical protein
MTLEQRIDRLEGNVGRLAVVQDEMMDLLGLSLEGERRLATRTERLEENLMLIEEKDAKLRDTVNEIGDRLNALIAVVDDVVRGKR